jgi:hypothetical protein
VYRVKNQHLIVQSLTGREKQPARSQNSQLHGSVAVLTSEPEADTGGGAAAVLRRAAQKNF